MIKLTLIAAIILLTLYLIYVVKNYGVQKSISFSDYITVNHKNAFETTLYYCGVGLIAYGVLSEIVSVIISGVFIIGVAIYSDFMKSKIFNTMHMIYAFGGFTLMAITPLLLGEWMITAAIAALTIGTNLIAKTNKLWWTEVAVIYSSFIGLLLIK